MKKTAIWISLLTIIALAGTGCGQTGTKENAGNDGTAASEAITQEATGAQEETAAQEENVSETAAKEASSPASEDYSKYAGDWYVDGSLDNGHISIDKNGHVESYSYDDIFNYEGELKREEYENPDGTKGYLYNIYDDGGEFVIGFYEPEEEDFYELYSGQDGEVHYVRSDHCTGGTGKANPNQTAH